MADIEALKIDLVVIGSGPGGYAAIIIFDDKTESNAHKDQLYYLENIVNLSDDFKSNLVLYKFVGDCVKDTSFNIYMDDNGNNTNRFLSLGKHHYIKVYSVVRNISTKKYAFFTFQHSQFFVALLYN